MNKLQKYVKERDAMLLKCDVEELRKFVMDHASYFSVDYVEAICIAPVNILEITLHKMIVNVTSMPKELKNKSAKWLLERGYSGEIGGRI